MTLSKTWNNTSYNIPEVGEFNWQSLTSFLAALADNAQTINFQKMAVRVATASPVSVSAANDCIVITDLAVAGPVAVTLPAGVSKQLFFIVDGKGDASTNNITITPTAGNINGAASYVLNVDKGAIGLIYDGTEWTVFAEFGNFTSGSGTIPRAKIAAGTASHVVINDGSGFLSSEAQLASTRGGTGVSNAGTLTYGANNITITTGGATSVTFPTSGTLATLAGTEELSNKTLVTPLVKGGSIDVDVAGALAIGASVGANNVTLGGATSTLVVPGNLTVSGTTTSINTTNTDVTDKNITVNKGGNDASSEGAGITVERTGTDGSIIYKDASASKFACGPVGSEVDVVDLSSAQNLTNKGVNGATAVEIGYVAGVTGAIQTQLGNKQPLDATLTSLAAYNTNGILAQTAADTFAGRTISGTANRIGVTNGDGVAGNPTLDIGSDVVTLTGTQALTNKDYDGGTASNTSRITLPKDTTANLTSLTRKAGTIVYDTTTSKVNYDDGTNLIELATPAAPYVGQTDGTTVAAGNIGEVLEYTTSTDFSQGSPVQNAWYDVTSASVTITPGVWRIYASGTAGLNWSNSSGTPFPTPHMGIRTAANTLLASAVATTPGGSSSAFTSFFGTTFAEAYQAVGSSTTIKLSVKWSQATAGTASVSNIDLRADPIYYSSIVLRAIRIA